MTDHNVPRDRWGRPLLYTPEGGERQPYTRISTMAKWCDDKGGLIQWSSVMSMVGMMKSKPLQARVSSIIARNSGDVYADNKGQWRELTETAKTIAQSQGRADFGTAIHEFTELVDAGTLDWSYVPDALKGPLDAYQEATADLTLVDSEVFVTVDEHEEGLDIRGAGSFDRLYHHPELGVVVADLKTGSKEPSYPLGVSTQVAIYARGQRYRDTMFPGTPEFSDGTPNEDGTAFRKPLADHVSHSTGLMIHCPLEQVKGKFVCNLYPLDLELGWKSLVMGAHLQEIRKVPKLRPL